jgi:hypothetical protein
LKNRTMAGMWVAFAFHLQWFRPRIERRKKNKRPSIHR